MLPINIAMPCFCDIAEVNATTNDFKAWGKVYINQKGKIKAWGDSLIYDGVKEVGKLYGDVKMKSENSLLKNIITLF